MRKINKLVLVTCVLFLSACVQTQIVKNPPVGRDITIGNNEGLIVTSFSSNYPESQFYVNQNDWGPSTNNLVGRALLSFDGKDGRFRVFKVTSVNGGLYIQFWLRIGMRLLYAKEQKLKLEFIPGQITYIGDIYPKWDVANEKLETIVTDKERDILNELHSKYPSLLQNYKFNKILATPP